MDIVLKYEGVWQVLFSAELFRKSTVIFPEIPPEISELTTLVIILDISQLLLEEFQLNYNNLSSLSNTITAGIEALGERKPPPR